MACSRVRRALHRPGVRPAELRGGVEGGDLGREGGRAAVPRPAAVLAGQARVLQVRRGGAAAATVLSSPGPLCRQETCPRRAVPPAAPVDKASEWLGARNSALREVVAGARLFWGRYCPGSGQEAPFASHSRPSARSAGRSSPSGPPTPWNRMGVVVSSQDLRRASLAGVPSGRSSPRVGPACRGEAVRVWAEADGGSCFPGDGFGATKKRERSTSRVCPSRGRLPSWPRCC